jgi:dihydropteroate synthase
VTHRFRARGKAFELGRRTWLIGVVNVTPDSFFDGGLYFEPARAIERALALAAEGADIIDIGGESSRPGSHSVSAKEEKGRILPVVEVLKQKKDVLISVDTTKAEVAEAALAAGAHIINDISAGRFDPRMLPLAAGSKAGLILMAHEGHARTTDRSHYDDAGRSQGFLGERLEALSPRRTSGEYTSTPMVRKKPEHNLALLNLGPIAELSGRFVGIFRSPSSARS